MFNETVLDSECTDLICENFLSTFHFNEVERVIQILVSKMRMNSLLTIQEVDNKILSRRSYIEDLQIDQVNELLFAAHRKNILTSDKIDSLMVSGMNLEHTHYNDTSCVAVMRYRRTT